MTKIMPAIVTDNAINLILHALKMVYLPGDLLEDITSKIKKLLTIKEEQLENACIVFDVK